jgi:hypothetical protein
MLGSFFLAALMSALIACVAIGLDRLTRAQSSPWLMASLALAIVFGAAFRAQ